VKKIPLISRYIFINFFIVSCWKFNFKICLRYPEKKKNTILLPLGVKLTQDIKRTVFIAENLADFYRIEKTQEPTC